MVHTTPMIKPIPIAVIEQLAIYVATGVAGLSIIDAEQLVGEKQLRRVSIAVLDWLKARRKFPNMRTMRLSEVGSASAELVKLIKEVSSFSATFEINENSVKFKDDIESNIVEEILSMAEAQYKPVKFTTKRFH